MNKTVLQNRRSAFSRAVWLAATAGLFFGMALLEHAQVGTVAGAQRARIASKPPLGWNSFDSYGVYLHEKAAMENLEAMAQRLQPYGYEYFVIDNGWFGEYKLRPGTLFPIEKHASDVRLNEYGHVMPSKVYFPGGLKRIVDRCHELGLKFGIHMMRGIPRKAYEMNLPIKGTSYKARDVADTNPQNQCRWCLYNYGVDMSKPGAQEWYDGLMQHLADMGVDLIKYDDIVPYPAEVEAVAKAVKKTGRPMLLSLSPGGNVPPDAIASFKMAHMLRVTRDVWDQAQDLDECFDAWRKWAGKESEGFWIDMDMIPFGQLLMMSPKKDAQLASGATAVKLAGNGYRRWSQFSPDQMLTFITLRALSASPLMVGGDLPTLDGFSLRLLTDPDMLACNQNGVMGTLVSAQDGIEVWKTPEKGRANRGWVGVFNRSNRLATVSLTPAFLGLETEATLYDVWKGRKAHRLTSAAATRIDVNPHGVLFLRYESEAGPQPSSPPNILLIHADDLGYGDLSAYGQERFRTPALDRLAREGTRFTQYYSGSTVCAPSRAALLTGYHSGHNWIRGNGEVPLRAEDVTLGEVLRDAGYRTAVIGKWGLGTAGTAGRPDRQGFEYSFGFLDHRHAHRQFTDHLYRNAERVAVDLERDYVNDLFTKEAAAFIEQDDKRPFFIYLSYTVPHAELRVPDDAIAPFRGRFPEQPFSNPKADARQTGANPDGATLGYRSQPEPRAAFAAMVTRMDRDIGKLADLLRKRGIDRRTLVLFTSDNGPHKEAGADPVFFNSSGGLRGIKRDLYEGGIRVPMIAHWPGAVPEGRVSDHVWAHWDMLPTLAEVAGGKAPTGLDGMSMARALRGQTQPAATHLYWEFHERGFQQAVRMGQWKAVRLKNGATLELYNLDNDPKEERDVAAANPDIVRRIESYLESARTESQRWPVKTTPGV